MKINFGGNSGGSGGGVTPQQATNIVRNTATGVVVDSLTDVTNPQKGQVAIIPEGKEFEKYYELTHIERWVADQDLPSVETRDWGQAVGFNTNLLFTSNNDCDRYPIQCDIRVFDDGLLFNGETYQTGEWAIDWRERNFSYPKYAIKVEKVADRTYDIYFKMPTMHGAMVYNPDWYAEHMGECAHFASVPTIITDEVVETEEFTGYRIGIANSMRGEVKHFTFDKYKRESGVILIDWQDAVLGLNEVPTISVKKADGFVVLPRREACDGRDIIPMAVKAEKVPEFDDGQCVMTVAVGGQIGNMFQMVSDSGITIVPQGKIRLPKPTQYYIFDGSEWQNYGDNGAFNYDIEEERVQARNLLSMNLPVEAYVGTTGVGGKVQMNVSTSGYFDNYSYINAWNGTPRMRDMRNGEISLNAQNMAILKIYITDSTGEATIVGRNFDEGYIRDAFGKTYSNEPNMGKSLEVSLANTKFYAEVWYMNDEGLPTTTIPYYMPLIFGGYRESNSYHKLLFEDFNDVINVTFYNSFDDSSLTVEYWQKEWIGTQAEYDALTVTHPSTEYYITEG